MKALRTLLLGSAGAALLFTMGSVAQAGGAPGMVDKGREPVYRCDTAGFIEFPGSDVCFKIGGKVAAWIAGVDENGVGREELDEFGVEDDRHSRDDTFFMDALARFNIDIRKPSEFGIVRIFMEFEANDSNSSSGTGPNFRHGFVQIGRFLIGKTWSTFRSFAGTPEVFCDCFGAVGDQATVRVVQLRYTFQVGNGVTINVAIEDQAFFVGNYDTDNFPVALLDWGGDGLDTFALLRDSRNEMPDFVANIQVSGTWGKFQLSGALHQESYQLRQGFCLIFSCFQVGPTKNDRDLGWAVMASLAINVPRTMGDVIYLSGGYADGHVGALDTGAAFAWHPHWFHAGVPGSVEATTAWQVAGGWEHYWRSDLRSTFAASHVSNDYPNWITGPAIDNATSVWANLVWTAAPKLDIGVEVMWVRNDWATSPFVGPVPVGDAIGVGGEVVASF